MFVPDGGYLFPPMLEAELADWIRLLDRNAQPGVRHSTRAAELPGWTYIDIVPEEPK